MQDAPKVIEKNEWDLSEDHELSFNAPNINVQAFGRKYTISGAYTWQFQFKQYNENWQYVSDQLVIEVVCDLNESEEPVSGVFQISDSDEVGTARKGTFNMSGGVDGFGLGTYFKYYENDRWAAGANGGEVEITKNDDGTYTITFDFLDGQAEPKHFKGTWTGELSRPW